MDVNNQSHEQLLETLRKAFKPTQPAVKSKDEKVVYREVHPSGALKNYVYCFWQLETTQPLHKPFVYRVVSDGCIDIYFNVNASGESFVMGFCRKFTEFPIG